MSTFRNRMDGKRKGLGERQEESTQRGKDNEKAPKSLVIMDNLPEGREMWVVKEGDHLFDIVPFETGNNHPHDAEGDLSFNVEYYQHGNIGAGFGTYPCNQKNWGEPCSICEYIADNQLDSDAWNKLKPKWYVAYLTAVYSTSELEKKGTMILAVPHFFMQNHLNKLQYSKRTGNRIDYADYENGRTIGFNYGKSGTFKTDSGEKKPSFAYTGHVLEKREDENGEKFPLLDEYLDSQFPLDEALNLRMDYDDLKRIFETGQNIKSSHSEDSSRNAANKRNESKPEQQCPMDMKFGVDFKNDVACDDCNAYDDCEGAFILLEDDNDIPREAEKKEPAPEQSSSRQRGNRSQRNTKESASDAPPRGRSNRGGGGETKSAGTSRGRSSRSTRGGRTTR